MTADGWWTAFGWAGSALVVLSLMQTKFLRLRIFNLIACLIVMVYHIPLAIWPTVALNGVLALVNAVYLIRLLRSPPSASDNSHQDDESRS